jgi:hypothetical protein
MQDQSVVRVRAIAMSPSGSTTQAEQARDRHRALDAASRAARLLK